MTRVIRVCDDKYQFHIDEKTSTIANITRYNEPWPTALESWQHAGAILALCHHIMELEDKLASPNKSTLEKK